MQRFTKAKGEEIVNLIRGGAGVNRAARLAGCHPDAIRRWRREGERNPKSAKGAFALAVTRAQSKLLAGCERTIYHNAIEKKDSHDAKWLLSKLAPDEYGDKRTIEVKVRDELQSLLERIEPHLRHASSFPDIIQAIAAAEGFELGGMDEGAGEALH